MKALTTALLAVVWACGETPPREVSAAQWLSWPVADTGVGPVRFGMTPDQANAAAGGSLLIPEGLTADMCAYASPRGVEGLGFMIEQGLIVRVDVRRPGIRTAAGAAVGDSEARIQQLYSGRVQVSPHKYTAGRYLTVLPPDSTTHPYRLIFETDGAVVTRYRAGMLPQVAYVEGCS